MAHHSIHRSIPISGYSVDVDGKVMPNLTEQEAWETFLAGCGTSTFASVKMTTGSRVLARREAMTSQRR